MNGKEVVTGIAASDKYIMLLFFNQKLVFLSVPKTGTTALEAAAAPYASAVILNPPGMKHVSVTRYKAQLAPFFEARGKQPHETMAIMREPIDWLGSWYRYRRRDQIRGKPNSTAHVSFSEFVEAWLAPDPPAFAQVGSQARFLGHEGAMIGVDHLFRYDQMERAVAFLSARLEVDLVLEARNVSPQMALELPKRIMRRVQAERPEEFALWQALCSRT
ncbi:gamma-glutamyl kinase [Rhodobacteraceae bacterium XHP0102]|nr:gamma-glutamyl kinase [Rhodobacteraceae bacterium XHP0102]